MFKCGFKDCSAKCCRELRYAIIDYSYDLDEKRYIHLLVPTDKATIGLTLEEKDKLESKAKMMGINLLIKPLKCIITKNDEPIIIKWFIDHDSCPFLDEDYTCRIYEDRPIICRAFPLIPIIKDIGKRILCKSEFCPYTRDITAKSDEEIKSEFCSCYDSYCRVREYNCDLEKKIEELVHKGLVKRIQMRAAIRLFNNSSSRIRSFDEYYLETTSS